MIKFATKETQPILRKMWQEVFGDDEKYLDIYFSKKYKEENSLIYFENDEPTASLQMWEYKFVFYDEIIPCYYMAGLATYPQHRRKGYMAALINEAFEVMKSRKIPFSILIPAEEWLYNFYANYGYAHTFEQDDTIIPIKKIVDRYKTREEAFEVFNKIYNKGSFKVLKDREQFDTIVEEQILSDFETKTNLDGLSRAVDVFFLLKIYAKNNPKKKFTIKVSGDKQIKENNAFYTIEDGKVSKFVNAIADFNLNIIELCELLLGHENEELPTKIYQYFPKHLPCMNLMLE